MKKKNTRKTYSISAKDFRLFDIAKKIAILSDCRQKHGAVIVKSGRVLGLAHNRDSTHPDMFKHMRDTIHAEQRAMILASADLSGSTVYSARITGELLSKPCSVCTGLMRDAGVDRVVYFEDGKLVKVGLDYLEFGA